MAGQQTADQWRGTTDQGMTTASLVGRCQIDRSSSIADGHGLWVEQARVRQSEGRGISLATAMSRLACRRERISLYSISCCSQKSLENSVYFDGGAETLAKGPCKYWLHREATGGTDYILRIDWAHGSIPEYPESSACGPGTSRRKAQSTGLTQVCPPPTATAWCPAGRFWYLGEDTKWQLPAHADLPLQVQLPAAALALC